MAWYVENFRRHDPRQPLPDLRKLLRDSRGEPQTANEQVQALYALSARYGLKLKVTKATHGPHHADAQ